MANRKRGVRIGNYRITPLGVGTIIALIVIIAAVIVLFVVKPFGLDLFPDNSKTTAAKVSATPGVSVAVAPTATATPVPTATPTPAPELRSATIRSLGEIAIQQNLLAAAYDSETKTYDFTDMFEYISDVMGDADYTVGDVEGSLGGTMDATGEGTRLVTPPSLIDALKACGVDMLTLANDHALDGMFGDLTAAMQNLKNAGMEYIGTAMTQEEKDTPKIVEINGIKVGFLAYTESLNGMEAKSDADAVKYGVNLITGNTTPDADTKALRDAGCALVVVSYHWGEEKDYVPNERQVPLGRATIDAGADLVIGHHSHRMNPIEAYKGKYICYSLGNFSFAGNSRPDDMDTYIFQQRFRVYPDGTAENADMRIIPCSISSQENVNDFKPTPKDADGAAALLARLDKLNAQFEKAFAKTGVTAVSPYPTAWTYAY